MAEFTYGTWIPILSTKVLPLDSAYQDLAKEEKISDKGDTSPFEISRNNVEFDSKGFKKKATFSFCKAKHSVLVNAKISKSGLLLFTFSINDRYPSWVRQVFAKHVAEEIKDLYHHHTHHSREDDATLPVILINDNGAAEKDISDSILARYEQKMLGYPRQLRPNDTKASFLQEVSHFLRRATGVSAAKKIRAAFILQGEFKYAESFVMHFRSIIGAEDVKDNVERFRLATESMEIKKSDYIWQLGHYVTVIAVILAIIGIITNLI